MMIGPSASLKPAAPHLSNSGSDASTKNTHPVFGSPTQLYDLSPTKKLMIQSEKILSMNTKGALPLELNLYYVNFRSDFNQNQQGDTPIGPCWVLNHNMRIEDAINSDDLIFRASTGDQIVF
ncbi:MAG TPA: hypothetical protein PLB62_05810, partial [Candidatus Sumerlaeota bacterium]|nr:hypothetical protein [Candidatus Sumerlaeota bacterium]